MMLDDHLLSLPVYSYQTTIEALCHSHHQVIFTAEPGSGKTTLLPLFLKQALSDGQIWILQPRRIAAQHAASYVAQCLSEPLGQSVGYRVRQSHQVGPKSRLIYQTYGIALQMLLQQPSLPGVTAILLDEFHQRTVEQELLFALLLQLQKAHRDDLKIWIMSATMDVRPIQEVMPQAACLHVPGKVYPVDIRYAAKMPKMLVLAVLEAVREALLSAEGDILVFVSGLAMIQKIEQKLLEKSFRDSCEKDFEVVILHGAISLEQQQAALKPRLKCKVILATNIAETSLTVQGVTTVIDTGLAKVSNFDSWSGLPTLEEGPICQAQAIQRAGRAGRLAQGQCLRLYTLQDFQKRPAFDVPEIARLELSAAVLMAHVLGYRLISLPLLTQPPESHIQAAYMLLERLGLYDEQTAALTALGKKLALLPLHPRLVVFLEEASRGGVIESAAYLAILLSESHVFRQFFNAQEGDLPLDMMQAIQLARQQQRFLGPLVQKLLRHFPERLDKANKEDRQNVLSAAVLRAFPDRVAARAQMASKATGAASEHYLLCSGGRILLPVSQALYRDNYVVILHAESRKQGSSRRLCVQLMTSIDASWLLELPDFMEQIYLTWNASLGKVERQTDWRYGSLVLQSTRDHDIAADEALPFLMQALKDRGIAYFMPESQWQALQGRWQQLQRLRGDLQLPTMDEAWLEPLWLELSQGKSSLEEIDPGSLLRLLWQKMPEGSERLLERWLPQRLLLPSGRFVTVHYSIAQGPYIEAKIQEFFGEKNLPTLAEGRLLLSVQLLAPNHRAVQITQDLHGFWLKHYPSLRKTLMRRYPKHFWPEDPLQAKPVLLKSRNS